MGSNSYGQIAMPSNIYKVLVPTRVVALDGVDVAKIACGANHAAVLTSMF